MPAWVKKSVTKRTISVSAGTPVVVETDPATLSDIAGADDQKSFLNVEISSLGGATLTAKLYRYEGARPDLLMMVDPVGTPYKTLSNPSGVTDVSWPTPAGAARKLRIDFSISAGTGTVTFEVDDVYRTTGA